MPKIKSPKYTQSDIDEWMERLAVRNQECDQLERERDDLQKAINGLCEHFKISPANTTLLAVEVLRIERERDEAREDADHWKSEYEIVVARLCGVKHERDNGIIFEHEIIPKLERERDQARNENLGWENKWKCAIEMAARAEVERDEARNAVPDGKWVAHEDYQKVHEKASRLLVAINKQLPIGCFILINTEYHALQNEIYGRNEVK